MTAPPFRAVDQHTAEVVPPPTDLAEQYCRTVMLANPDGVMNFPVLFPDVVQAEIACLREELAQAAADIDNLTDLLKASGAHVANLSSGVAMYIARAEDYRERLEEQKYRADAAEMRLQELEAELAEAKRDVVWMSGVPR